MPDRMSIASRQLGRAPGIAALAPRFVVRVVAIAFATVAGVLVAMSTVFVLETRSVVERNVATR